jgi:hypothetical protein
VDKIVGKAENIVGDIEGKPGKKVKHPLYLANQRNTSTNMLFFSRPQVPPKHEAQTRPPSVPHHELEASRSKTGPLFICSAEHHRADDVVGLLPASLVPSPVLSRTRRAEKHGIYRVSLFFFTSYDERFFFLLFCLCSESV